MKKLHLFLIIITATLLLNNCMVMVEENFYDYYISYALDGHFDDFDTYNGDFRCHSTFYLDSWYCKWESFDKFESIEIYYNEVSDNFEYIIYDYKENYYTEYSVDAFHIFVDEIDEYDNYIGGHFSGFLTSAEYNSENDKTIIHSDSEYISGDFMLPLETY